MNYSIEFAVVRTRVIYKLKKKNQNSFPFLCILLIETALFQGLLDRIVILDSHVKIHSLFNVEQSHAFGLR